MGSVHRARDRRDGTTVAIKLLHAHLEADDTFRQRFEREAHFAALLRSPYTVQLLDYGVEHGTYFIAMEYVEGRSLRDAIRGDGRVEPAEALRIGVAVAHALEEAEARGVVHRDIKPDNILLGNDGAVKVSDFGIARQLGSGAVTMPGAFVGTLVYAAPEIARGEVDHRSDIYSLGATLYDALTGRPPFEGQPLEVLRHHADSPVPEEPLASVPSEAREIILRCMAKDPDDRYQTASQLAPALEQAAAAVPAAKPQTSAPDVEATQIATPTPPPPSEPVGATEVMRPPSDVPQAVPSGPSIDAQLSPPRGGFFAARLGSMKYPLTLSNRGDEQATVTLTAQESSGRATISVPSTASVPAGTSKTVLVAAKPRKRRSSGGVESVPFTITAAGTGLQPATVVSGTFEDAPFPMAIAMGVMGATAAAVIAVIAFLVIGGGGGDEDGATGLSEDDFARMMLTQEDLSPAFSQFSEDRRLSGPISNEDLIGDACAGGVVTSQVARDGRINGYETVYAPAQVAALALEIRSRVDQYETSVGASGALAFYAESQLTGSGELECRGVIVADRAEFTVSDLGDEARGVEGTRVSASSEPQANRLAIAQRTDVTTTAVVFAIGELVGRVEIDGSPGGNYRDLTEDLARRLESRILSVLDAESETPTLSPTDSATGSATPDGSSTPGTSGTTTPTATPTPPDQTPTTAPPGGGTAPPTAPPTSGPTAPPTAGPTAPPTAPPTQAPQAPAISTLGCPGSANVGQQITCQPTISGTVTSRSWSAPGGSPASGSGTTFSTTYNSAGAKTITLTACNGSACTNRLASVEVLEILIEGYTIIVDTFLDAGRNSVVTVSLYADVPSSGLAYWDIDVEFNPNQLTYQSCSAVYGECGLFFFEGAVTFTADVNNVGSGFIELGSMTFRTGSSPGFADLDPIVYGLEDAQLNDVTDEAFVVPGGISIQ